MAERDAPAVRDDGPAPGPRADGLTRADAAAGPAPDPGAARFEALVSDLRTLRLHGLVELRRMRLPALGGGPAAVEALLRAAVDALGPGNLGQAAGYTFGLAQGTRDWPAQDRRRRAAEVYGLSVERFRKQQERIIVEQVAEQILALGGRGAGGPAPAADPGRDAARRSPAEQVPARPAPPAAGDRLAFTYPVGPRTARVTVHVLPIELLRGVDVQVSTSNVYFEVSRIFGNTVSASLRRAAARTDAAGRVIDDVVQRELAAWVAGHGGLGTAVPPGTVAATAAGALAERGVRRIYHAAVAVPVGSGPSYVVEEAFIARAVHAVFATAALERESVEPPLASIGLPLIGCGRGGMDLDRSIRILWLALGEELRRDPSWDVHIAVRRSEIAARVAAHLAAEGAVPA
jgi:O-acetyl-ADP-ribose deacetylase (regulator of RNase III)